MFDLSYSCSMPVTPEPAKKTRAVPSESHTCDSWMCPHQKTTFRPLNLVMPVYSWGSEWCQLSLGHNCHWHHEQPWAPHDYLDWGRSEWETSPEQKASAVNAVSSRDSMWVVCPSSNTDLAFKAKSTTTVSTWCLSLKVWLSARKSEIKTPWELWGKRQR